MLQLGEVQARHSALAFALCFPDSKPFDAPSVRDLSLLPVLPLPIDPAHAYVLSGPHYNVAEVVYVDALVHFTTHFVLAVGHSVQAVDSIFCQHRLQFIDLAQSIL